MAQHSRNTGVILESEEMIPEGATLEQLDSQGSQVRQLQERMQLAAKMEKQARETAVILGMLKAVSMVLSARLLLLLGLFGAFALGFLAVQQPDPARIVAAGVYFVGVFLPLVALQFRQG